MTVYTSLDFNLLQDFQRDNLIPNSVVIKIGGICVCVGGVPLNRTHFLNDMLTQVQVLQICQLSNNRSSLASALSIQFYRSFPP